MLVTTKKNKNEWSWISEWKKENQTWNLILITSRGDVTVLEIPPEIAPAEASSKARLSWVCSPSIASPTRIIYIKKQIIIIMRWIIRVLVEVGKSEENKKKGGKVPNGEGGNGEGSRHEMFIAAFFDCKDFRVATSPPLFEALQEFSRVSYTHQLILIN